MTQSHISARHTAFGRLRQLPRPAWPDVLAAVLLAYIGALNVLSPVTAPAIVLGGAGTGVFAVLVAVCSVCVLLRRVVPTASVTITCLACVVHLACFDTLSTLVVGAGLLAVETTTSRVPRPWAWGLLACQASGAAAGILLAWYRFSEAQMDLARATSLIVVALVCITAAALAGLLRRRTRERQEQARERLELLTLQRETERRLAVVQERNRIARDVHDLVGHSLSVIGMQAEGARAVLASSPADAERALAVIGETSRRAVDDVRALVDVLRSDDEESGLAEAARAVGPAEAPEAAGPAEAAEAPGASRATEHPAGSSPAAGPEPARGAEPAAGGLAGPTGLNEPGVEDVPGLVAGVREAGTALTLRLTVAAVVPAPVGACAYRVVQEALTNAVRHAPGRAVEVGIDVTGERLDLVVSNTGPGSVSGAAFGLADDTDSTASGAPGGRSGRTGLGLVSMTERVHAVGGTFTAGALPDGGWQVHAVVPLTGGEQ